MMKVFRYYLPVIALILFAAYGGYIYGGHKARREDSRLFELLNYSSLATSVKIKVKLLNLIDNGKSNDAKTFIDKFIDVDLASLCLYDKLAQTCPDQNIFDAIAAVKTQRAAHPGHKVSETLSSSVERALNIMKPAE